MYVKDVEQVAINNNSLYEVATPSYEMLELYYENSSTYAVQAVEGFSARHMGRYNQPNHIREALKQGYVEMSHINLSICKECLHAEYEAEHMVERLVTGR